MFSCEDEGQDRENTESVDNPQVSQTQVISKITEISEDGSKQNETIVQGKHRLIEQFSVR